MLKQRLSVSHEPDRRTSVEFECTIRSAVDGQRNVIFLLDEKFSNLKVVDGAGVNMPVMPDEFAKNLILDYMHDSDVWRSVLRDMKSEIDAKNLHPVWIQIPQDRAMKKDESRVFTITYLPPVADPRPELITWIRQKEYPLYYTLFSPPGFRFGKERYYLNDGNKIMLISGTPKQIQKITAHNSIEFRQVSEFNGLMEVRYSFSPTPVAATPTKIGLVTLTSIAGTTLASWVLSLLIPSIDSTMFSRGIEIGLFTIGGSLILPQLASNSYVRARYARMYWIPISLGAALLGIGHIALG